MSCLRFLLSLKSLPVFLAAVLLSSCLRYVPPRSEMENQAQNGNIVDYEVQRVAFEELEKQQRELLEALLEKRGKSLVDASDSGYRIGVGDLIEVNVFSLPELGVAERVSNDGKIAMPLIGEVLAEGLSDVELRVKITKELLKYVRNPQVRVTISGYEANKVFLVGEVQTPGVYPLKRRHSLITELISEAGGRTELASGSVIFMPATENLIDEMKGESSSQLRGIEIDFEDLVGSVDKRPLLIPLVAGDTIIIPKSGNVQVTGEVDKPGTYKLSSKTSALGAIAASGGLTYSANVKEVEVIRELGSGEKISVLIDLEKIALNEQKDIRLRDGDILRVPSDSNRFAKRQVVEVLNRLFRVGVSGRVN